MVKRQIVNVRKQDILLLSLYFLWLLNRAVPMDCASACKAGILLTVYAICRQLRGKQEEFVLLSISLWGACESIVAILQSIHYIESRHHAFIATGSFENPAPLGGLLAVSLFTTILLYKEQNYKSAYIKISFITTIACIAYGLVLSDSRAGYLAVIIGAAYMNKETHSSQRKYIKIAFPMLILIFIVLLYARRPQSADGRLFIWLNTCRMITDHPILGIGTGGWLANYMYYQADYFNLHPNSHFIGLADNVFYTYNEALHWIAEHGAIGGIILLWGLSILSRDNNCRNAKVLFLIYATFACFSYPMSVFRLQLLLVILLSLQKTPVIYKPTIHPKFFPYASLYCFIGFFMSMYCIYLTDKHSFYRFNARYMHYYAQREMASNNHSINEKLSVLQHASQIVPTCELYTDMGDLWLQNRDTIQAESCYQTAANMIPNRMTPNYKLFHLYVSCKDEKSALSRGQKILSTPVKKESSQTLRMKSEAIIFLQNIKNE